jgi:hypothetical protein
VIFGSHLSAKRFPRLFIGQSWLAMFQASRRYLDIVQVLDARFDQLTRKITL